MRTRKRLFVLVLYFAEKTDGKYLCKKICRDQFIQNVGYFSPELYIYCEEI